MDKAITFETVCEWEPRLVRLDHCVRGIKDTGHDSSFCANLIWYELVKPRLVTLVGWHVPEKRGGLVNLADGTVTGQEETPPGLRSSEAYAVVYDHLYRQLPDCRNCKWCL